MNRRTLLVLIPIVFIATIVVLLISTREKSPSTSEQLPANTETVGEISQLENVNAEEDNEVLRRLGLPYENDSVAISYTEDPEGNYGVRLIVTAKAGQTSAQLPEFLNSYARVRGVEIKLLKVEYR